MKKEKHNDDFAFTKENYKLLFIALGVIALGFLMMIGGGSDDPNVFKEEELFSARRITIAPLTVLAGYGLVVYAIMKRPKAQD